MLWALITTHLTLVVGWTGRDDVTHAIPVRQLGWTVRVSSCPLLTEGCGVSHRRMVIRAGS